MIPLTNIIMILCLTTILMKFQNVLYDTCNKYIYKNFINVRIFRK